MTTLTGKSWKVTKGFFVLAKGEKIGTLYLCIGNICSNIALASTNGNTLLLHNRLGHMSEKPMKILHSRKLLPGLKQVNLELCENCVYGK